MEDSASKQVVPGKVNLLTLEKLKAAIINSELVLPEFQRPDVWGDSEKKELIVSLCMGMPLGSFLIWEHSNNYNLYPHHQDTKFRAFNNQTLVKQKVNYTLLDGQQRMSLIWDLENSDFAKKHKVCFEKVSGGIVRPRVVLKEFETTSAGKREKINVKSEIGLNNLAGKGDREINVLDTDFKAAALRFRKSVNETEVPAHIFDKTKKRNWVMYVYQISNSAGKKLQQEDYALATFSFLDPDFPKKMNNFLSALCNSSSIKEIEKKLSPLVFIRCMLDDLYDSTSFTDCRKLGLDMLNIRIIDPKTKLETKFTPTMLEKSFKKVKKSFTLIEDTLSASWQIKNGKCLTINELLIMSAWYRRNPKPKKGSAGVKNWNIKVGEMSRWMMTSMVTKSTTGGATQATATEACRNVRNETDWVKTKKLLKIKEIQKNQFGTIDSEMTKKVGDVPKSAIGTESMMFHLMRLSFYRNNATDIFDGTKISNANSSSLNVDHFYPKAALKEISNLRLRQNHLANYVLMKSWTNKSKNNKWPCEKIKEIGWPKSKNDKDNFSIHCLPTNASTSWLIRDPANKFKNPNLFVGEYLTFLRTRTNRLTRLVNETLDDIEKNGF